MVCPNLPCFSNNRYQLKRLLGVGGFGATYLAEDKETRIPARRQCVIKQFKPDVNNERVYEIALQQFEQEAAIIEKLKHDQIPHLYDYFEENGQFYLVQEWIEGLTLSQQLSKFGPLQPSLVEQILCELLPVIEYIHSHGVIHRDIKPSNVILSQKDNKPILIDFGSVKQTVKTMVSSSGAVTCSIVVGSHGFMPPEQAAGRVVYSSDLYSLGITAIYLLTGRLPNNIEIDPWTYQFLWQRHTPQISPQLAAVLNKVIEFNPRDRYSTAREMLQALQLARPSSVSNVLLTKVWTSPQPEMQSFSKASFEQEATTPFQSRRWWSLGSGIAPGLAAVFVTGAAGAYLYSQWQVYQQNKKKRDELEVFYNQGDFTACQNSAQTVSEKSKLYDESQNLLNQCRLEEAKALASEGRYQDAIAKAGEIPDESPNSQEAQELTTTWSSNLEAEAQLEAADKLASQGKLKSAIAAAMEVPLDSSTASDAWNKIADWTHLQLNSKLDTQLPPQNVPARSLKWLGGNLTSGPEKPVQTLFGQVQIDANRNQWRDYQKPEGPLAGSRNFAENFGDAWQETYEVVPGKMRLGIIYGCMKNITVQTDVYFNASVELGLIKAKLNRMVGGQANQNIQQQLEQVYQGKVLEHIFSNGRFIGLIRRLEQHEILIVVRAV